MREGWGGEKETSIPDLVRDMERGRGAEGSKEGILPAELILGGGGWGVGGGVFQKEVAVEWSLGWYFEQERGWVGEQSQGLAGREESNELLK